MLLWKKGRLHLITIGMDPEIAYHQYEIPGNAALSVRSTPVWGKTWIIPLRGNLSGYREEFFLWMTAFHGTAEARPLCHG
jgi:hypothetical protein